MGEICLKYGWNMVYKGGVWIEYGYHMGYISGVWVEQSGWYDQYHKKWKVLDF